MPILDLLNQRGLKPVKVSGTHGGEYASPCPGCGGRDRFRAWPEQQSRGCDGGTWYCRGCNQGGDCIQFLRVFDGLNYHEACKALGVEAQLAVRSLSLPRDAKKPPFAPQDKIVLPPQPWRDHALKLVEWAHLQLLADAERMAGLARRGLPLDAVVAYRLGWLPGEDGRDCYFRDRATWGLPPSLDARGRNKPLWIPSGLVVPALGASGDVLRMRVRRTDESRAKFSPDMKYAVIPGSSMHPLLLRPHCRAFVVTESELDAMACAAAAEWAGLDVGALAVGTNMGKPDVAAHASLKRAQSILVALDFDAPKADGTRPGAQGYAFWAETYPTAKRWPVPLGKDPGEAVEQGVDLLVWLRAGLPPVFSMPESSRPGPTAGPAPASASAPAPASAPAVSSAPAPASSSPGQVKGPEAREFQQQQQGAGKSALGESGLPLIPPGGKTRADWLTTAAGPLDSLAVLRRAGLRAEIDGDDFRVLGHERWTDVDQMRLMRWLRRNGQWVHMALHRPEYRRAV